jgi:hypothetical protein
MLELLVIIAVAVLLSVPITWMGWALVERVFYGFWPWSSVVAYHWLGMDKTPVLGEREEPWVESETRSVYGTVRVCRNGYHAASTPSDAWLYVTGGAAWLCRVRLKGSLRRLGDIVGAVVARDHFRAAGLERVAARQARTAEAEDGDRLACKGSDGNQPITSALALRGRPAPASPR